VIAAAPIAGGWWALAGVSVPIFPIPPAPPTTIITVEREVPAYTNPSVIRVANLALQRIGVSQPIASLEERSKEARVIRQVWDHVRDMTLQEFSWPFATTYAALALTDELRAPWQYAYRMPADCLHPQRIDLGSHILVAQQRVPFEVQSSTNGPMIVTDAEAAILVYLARLIDPLDWPTWFHDLLAWAVADAIAMPLTVDLRVQQVVTQRLAQARIMAAQRAVSTGQPVVTDDSSAFVRARGGMSSVRGRLYDGNDGSY